MRKVSLDTWIQLLGMVGLLGGLVFVGLEMRQSQTIAVAGQTQSRNQAIMDFGSLQCSPKSPDCEQCPLQFNCIAYRDKTVNLIPIKSKKIKQTHRYFNFLVISDGKSIIIEKRIGKGIWENLYQFPLHETDISITNQPTCLQVSNNEQLINVSHEIKHILSHQILHCKFWEFRTNEIKPAVNQKIISIGDIQQYGVPRVVENYLNSNAFLKVYN